MGGDGAAAATRLGVQHHRRLVAAITINYNVDAPNGWVASYFFGALRQLTADKPVLVSEWFFAAHENRTGNRNRTGYPNAIGDPMPARTSTSPAT